MHDPARYPDIQQGRVEDVTAGDDQCPAASSCQAKNESRVAGVGDALLLMPLADFGVVQAQLLIMENVDFQLQRQGFKQGLFGKPMRTMMAPSRSPGSSACCISAASGQDGQQTFDQHLAKQFAGLKSSVLSVLPGHSCAVKTLK